VDGLEDCRVEEFEVAVFWLGVWCFVSSTQCCKRRTSYLRLLSRIEWKSLRWHCFAKWCFVIMMWHQGWVDLEALYLDKCFITRMGGVIGSVFGKVLH